MAKKKNVYFVDGLAMERDYFTVISYLHEYDLSQYEFSRIYFYDNGEWEHYEAESQVVSVARALIDGISSSLLFISTI